MITTESLTIFLGWCSAINIGILLFSTIFIAALGEPISKLHSKLFSLDSENLPLLYFQYLGHYKIAIIVLNLVPYIALKIMS